MSNNVFMDKFGIRSGPRLENKDILTINNLWYELNEIKLHYKIQFPNNFPTRRFNLNEVKQSKDKGWALFDFYFDVVFAALWLIRLCEDEMTFILDRRVFTYPQNKIKAVEVICRFKDITGKQIAFVYPEELKLAIAFIAKHVIANYKERR